MSRRVLVTGGTRGIGQAIVSVLVEGGDNVYLTGTSSTGAVPDGCTYIACDFSDMNQVEALAGRVATLDLDVLVNNAGVNKIGILSEYGIDDFLRIQQVNVTAPFLLCRSVVPSMQAKGFGRIVNITSIWGVVSKPERSAYSTSKFGLFGLSRALALEVAPDNVLVNCLAPGFVNTDLTRKFLGNDGIAAVLKDIPVGRLADPAEIARCVRFLASAENSYITGQNILVDGGFTSG